MAQETEKLRALDPYLMISNISFFSIAIAKSLGIPAIGYGSLNWFEICEPYFKGEPFLNDIRAMYEQADLFITCAPHLPTCFATKQISVAPVGRQVANIKTDILTRLNLPLDCKILFYSLGGVTLESHPIRVPEIDNAIWFFADNDEAPKRSDCHSIKHHRLQVIDLIAASDVVVTKPGYGMFVETALHHSRLLSCERPDWAEYPHMVTWAKETLPHRFISQDMLMSGSYQKELIELLIEDPTSYPDIQPGTTAAVDALSPFFL